MVNKRYIGGGGGRGLKCGVVKSICIILMLAAAGINELRFAHAGMTDSLTEGIKQAGQMFGINTAADVADLVAKAFSNTGETSTSSENKNPDFLSSLFQRHRRPTKKTSTTTTKAPSDNEEDDDLHEESQQQQNKQESPNYDLTNANLLASLLRMVGFDARKLGALALNALLMMAQAIGNTLLNAFTRKPPVVSATEGGRVFMNENGEWSTKPTDSQEKEKVDGGEAGEEGPEKHQNDREYRPRRARSGSPIDWFLKNPTDEMKEQLSQAMDSKLADKILELIEEYGKANPKRKVDCMKMLVCKTSPFIWAMQRSLEKRLLGIRESTEDEHEIIGFGVFNPSFVRKQLPSVEEFRRRSIVCEERYGKIC